MNYWHMQLHPNEHDDWTKRDILDLVENKCVIGFRFLK